MTRHHRIELLSGLMRERIVLLDGAMGTMIQSMTPSEEDFRGERLGEVGALAADHPELFGLEEAVGTIRVVDKPLKGDNDLLSITRPDMIYEIHTRMMEAGADIVETNTFNATAVSQSD
ncbi:MAG: homocysteine S-methyltransferase family protein, partial [Spirochaetota bacterium]